MSTIESDGLTYPQGTGELTTGSLSAAAIDAQSITMLLVEDNADDVMLARRMFRAAAPHVTLDAISIGQDAVAKAVSGRYDVAVVDYMLPDMSGMEVLHSLIAQDLPVIMVTGRGDETIAVQALKAGASDYLVKDAGYLRRLPQAVLGAVERSRLSRENRQLAAQTARQAGLLEAVMATDPGAIAVLRGPEYRIELANPSFRELLPDFDTLDALGKPLDEVFPRYADMQVRKALDKVYADGEPFHSPDVAFPTPDGSNRYFRFHMMPLDTGSQESERGVAVIIWDTTESMLAKQQIEALAEQAEAQRSWLQTVVDQMPLSVYIAAVNGETLLMNRAGMEMFGNPPSSLKIPGLAERFGITRPDGTPMPPDELPTARALAREETIIGLEMRAHAPDGRMIDTLTNASPLYDNKGKLIAAISVSQDITRLRDIDRMKDEFMSIASHELRTPLTNMKAAAQLVLRHAKQGAYPKHDVSLIDTIVQQSERMARLIEELLDVSRLQNGKFEIQPEPFDLSALVREVVYNSRVSHPGLRFDLLQDDEPVWVNADRDRIAQALGNLLDNAVKYGAQDGNGKVEVALQSLPDGKQARLEVKDNGTGFDPSQSEQIFERFSRLGSVNHHSRGMGLGLFICRQIIAAHGGTITAHSLGPGQGATFTITLPLNQL